MNKNIDQDELQNLLILQRNGGIVVVNLNLCCNQSHPNNYISSKVDLTDLNVLDVGCGGGLLTEALLIFETK